MEFSSGQDRQQQKTQVLGNSRSAPSQALADNEAPAIDVIQFLDVQKKQKYDRQNLTPRT